MEDHTMHQLKARLVQYKEWIEAALLDLLPERDTMPPAIHAAMHYGLMNGGKRLRPILLLEACRIGGGARGGAMPVACALEMVHSYSLIHDDLPCMDDDDWRRGKPTCHRVFGEATAVLAGDALLTRAFQTIAATALPPALRSDLTLSLAQAAGSQGMIGGQILDLEAEGKSVDLAQLRQIHALKTGALFHMALQGGALIAGMSPEGLAALERYADHFGMAFQITDDILDVAGDVKALGKPVGSDVRHQKSTYVNFFGLEEARDQAAEYVKACRQDLAVFGPAADFLRQLADYLLWRRS